MALPQTPGKGASLERQPIQVLLPLRMHAGDLPLASPDWLHARSRRSLPPLRSSHWPSLANLPPARSRNIPPLSLQVSVAGLSLLLLRRALRRERQRQVLGACSSSPGPGPSADGGGGRCGVLSSSGRSGGLWGGWGMADACPNWGDKSPQGKLPVALGPWPLWDQDEEQPETGSAGEEVEVEVELAAEAVRETDEPPE